MTIFPQWVDVSYSAANAEHTDMSIIGGIKSLSNQKDGDFCSMQKCGRQLFLKKFRKFGLHSVIG